MVIFNSYVKLPEGIYDFCMFDWKMPFTLVGSKHCEAQGKRARMSEFAEFGTVDPTVIDT
jgi:hypothetical protein